MSAVHFNLYNEATKNNISGITYLSQPGENGNNKYKITNNTPYHIFLAHATGFCKEVYNDLILELRKRGITSPITAIDMINHGDSSHDLPVDWKFCALDVYKVIEERIRPSDPNKTLIGIGHSMGGTVLSLVEIAHPKTFSCLVLLEPVLTLPPYGRSETTLLAEMTLKRKSTFNSKESIYSQFSSKPPFKSWTKGSLDHYINHGFKKSTGKDAKEMWELKIAKEQEAEYYRMGSAHGAYDDLPSIQIPFLVVHGVDSTFPVDNYDSLMARSSKSAVYKRVVGSHFFPMEYPDVVADVAVDFVRQVHGSKLSKL